MRPCIYPASSLGNDLFYITCETPRVFVHTYYVCMYVLYMYIFSVCIFFQLNPFHVRHECRDIVSFEDKKWPQKHDVVPALMKLPKGTSSHCVGTYIRIYYIIHTFPRMYYILNLRNFQSIFFFGIYRLALLLLLFRNIL